MKKLFILVLSGLLVIGLGAFLFAQSPQTNTQSRPNANGSVFANCPWYNAGTSAGTMMGHSMMGHSMMGRGMMGARGNGNMMYDGCGSMSGNTPMNSQMMGARNNGIFCQRNAAEFSAWRQSNKVSTPLSKDTAKRWAEYYINAYHNPDFVVGKIVAKNDSYEVEVRSKKSNKVLEKIRVDRKTGWITRVQN